MKGKFLISVLLIFASFTCFAEKYRNLTSGNLTWSDPSMWLISETSDPGEAPGPEDTFVVWYNSNPVDSPLQIYVDDTAEIQAIKTNNTRSCTTINLNPMYSDSGTSMTIDSNLADTTNSIYISWGDGVTGAEGRLNFEGVKGSSLTLQNSANDSAALSLRLHANSNSMTSATLRFGENVDVIAKNNVEVKSAYSPAAASILEVAGNFTLKNGDTYKNLSLVNVANGENSLIVEETGSIIANNLTLNSYSTVDIAGKVTLMQNSNYSMTQGKLLISGNLDIGDNAFNFAGGELTIASSNAITAGQVNIQGSNAGSVFTVAEGVTFAPTTLKFNTKQTINVNGTLNQTLTEGGMINVNIGKNGVYNVTNRDGSSKWTIFVGTWVVDGTLITSGFTNDSKIASGEMTVNEGATIIQSTGSIMMDGYQVIYPELGQKSVLTLNASNAFKKTESDSQSNFNIDIFRGKVTINVNADNRFGRLAFTNVTELEQAIVLTLNVAEGVVLEFNSISGLQSDRTATLIIEDFHLNSIKVHSLESSIDVSKISAEGWEDFDFVADATGGGYWLTATAIPEPAAFAGIFGLLAMAYCLRVKSKR